MKQAKNSLLRSCDSRRMRRGFVTHALWIALSLPWVGASLCAQRVDQAVRQRRAVELIQKNKGIIGYDFQFSSGNLRAQQRPPGPAWLRNLVGVDFLASVDTVSWVVINDQSVSALADLPRLRALRLSCDKQQTNHVLAAISGLKGLRSLGLFEFSTDDAGWKPLGKMTSLESLSITGELTAAALEQIKRLPHLWRLWLGSPQTKDATIRQFGAIVSLEQLSLIDCSEATDGTLLELGKLPHLSKVWVLGKTRITVEGMSKFQYLNPRVKHVLLDSRWGLQGPVLD